MRRIFHPTLPHSQTDLVILRGDNRRVVATDTTERVRENHCITATGLYLPNGHVPFKVRQQVINRLVATSFATTPVDHSDVGPLLEYLFRTFKPAWHNLTIAIDELNEFNFWINLYQLIITSVCARAAVNGINGSSSTTSTFIERANPTLLSIEHEST